MFQYTKFSRTFSESSHKMLEKEENRYLMKYLPILILSIILLIIILPFLFLHRKKKRILKKINSLSSEEKSTLINHLAEPFGYSYNPIRDIFTSHLEAPQKIFGYNTFYDWAATYFNMVFDYETIYFDYNGRTWLIEMWKGQYGITSGCELGIYYADSILSPDEYSTAHFYAVDESDMLSLSLELNDRQSDISPFGYYSGHHWWLTIFKCGHFSVPENLYVNIALRFKDYYMLKSFLNAFQKHLPDTPYRQRGLTLSFPFYTSLRQYNPFRKLLRKTALLSCSFYCKAFHHLTRDFTNSGDKILYLYYYLPYLIKKLTRPPHQSK